MIAGAELWCFLLFFLIEKGLMLEDVGLSRPLSVLPVMSLKKLRTDEKSFFFIRLLL